jgi:ABC-type Fe3+/spermidine/putrescine transport system ATPase subunit
METNVLDERLRFVADFESGLQQFIIERDGNRFTIRPEKIRMLDETEQPDSSHVAEPGRIHEVIYLGAITRYIVDLDAGGVLVVVRRGVVVHRRSGSDRGMNGGRFSHDRAEVLSES